MKRFTLLFLFFVSTQAIAQVNPSDTVKVDVIDTLKKDLLTVPDTVQHLHSKTKFLITPAALVGYGAISFYLKPLRKLDHYVYNEAAKHNIVTKSVLENYFQNAPVVLTYGLNLVGVHGKNTFIDRTLIFVLFESMLAITTSSLKHATHRLRPNQLDRLSFPSGHTSNAFAQAEFMAQELGDVSPYYSALGYAFATTTGIFRIYHQDHWLSDVVAGAGFGILATKGAYLLYPHLRNAFFKDKKQHPAEAEYEHKRKPRMSALLLPSYQNGTLGLSFNSSF